MTEHQLVEWKEVWRDEYLRWIGGFANADGGTLVIGRNDQGEAVGAPDAERLLTELPNKIRDLLGIVVPVRLVVEGDAQLVEIEVEPHPTPISYRGEYHVRSGATKQQLTGAALSAFLLRKFGRTWDAAPYPGVTAAELDPDAFKRFRRKARQSGRLDDEALAAPDAELVERLRLIENGMLKRSTLLLFHPDPERFCIGAYVKVGAFEDAVEVRYHDLIEGNLFKQFDLTLEVLRLKYLRARITYQGMVRVETYPVADGALREALLNAIVHKDYASGSPVQIRVYGDRLMIMNAGPLPSTWTLSTLLGPHRSLPPNPELANAFFRAGYIEAWGRGIEKIVAACRREGFPDPHVTYDGSGLCIAFPYSPEHVWASSDIGTEPVTPPVAGQVTGQVADQVTGQVADQVMPLLVICEGEMTRDALQSAAGLVGRANFRKRYLDPALTAGLIEMTVPDKPNSRLQKYRLTAQGRALLLTKRTP